ncbi:acetolactate synthase small subunit [Corynebacterium sp. 320]|uniref:Acetolactate synthase small subunit n=1 Tax=Corynebacterium zhongnanshanii TaxID=2768834 RepID=A0ABQ6VJE4_9CORY|nr:MULTISPECIES: acetolactate synthase small subunit [Corynebacterium]KAB1503899.1 acetolactate synthase small subunit [Corynebacterium sp. 320]KAB1553002.1 acetolactate synthase small subunit [Corynebacterium sp. 321]KAB1553778.1 acetolactate synthase small subunit [Corynebacterium sp. 319]KAB3523251.1 acetolactate synthase small subunit [Corynebacterium zhongnanshanii]KAB3528035.1 acetolactate synthase small subunit [Corynebacterium sp. 250]
MATIHTLSVLCEDVDGIMSRITGMFTRRAYNIISISSGRTEIDGINRITIRAEAEEHVMEQITKQLNKLIPVIKVSRHDPEAIVARALMLVKVSADNSTRAQVVESAKLFRAHVVDVGPDSVIIECTGTSTKLQALLDVLEPFGIRELVESSMTAMSRGPKAMYPSKL